MVTKSGDYKVGELANRIVEFGEKLLSASTALESSRNHHDLSWNAANAVGALSPYKDLDERHRRIVEALTDLACHWTPRRKGTRLIEYLDLRHERKEQGKQIVLDFRCTGIEGNSSVSDVLVALPSVSGQKMTLVFRIEKEDRAQ